MNENPQPPPVLVGDFVFYRLTSGPCEGEQRPAVVTAIGAVTGLDDTVLSLCVFIDPLGDDPLYEMRNRESAAPVLARRALEGSGVGEWQRELDLQPGEVTA